MGRPAKVIVSQRHYESLNSKGEKRMVRAKLALTPPDVAGVGEDFFRTHWKDGDGRLVKALQEQTKENCNGSPYWLLLVLLKPGAPATEAGDLVRMHLSRRAHTPRSYFHDTQGAVLIIGFSSPSVARSTLAGLEKERMVERCLEVQVQYSESWRKLRDN